MTEDHNNAGTPWGELIATPRDAVRLLAREPLLLAGTTASVLLVLIAIFGPAGGRLYAWLLTGLSLIVCLLWTVLRLSRRGAGPAQGVNEVTFGQHAEQEKVEFAAERANEVSYADNSTLRGVTFRAGTGGGGGGGTGGGAGADAGTGTRAGAGAGADNSTGQPNGDDGPLRR